MTKRREVSAGGVVYRRVEGEIEIAIAEQRDRITHRTTTRLPKGKIDPGESAADAAVREVAEEIGLRARVVAALGSVEYDYVEDSDRVSKEVHYFLMEWVPGESLELDGEMERTYWCPVDEAEKKLTFETEQRAIAWARAQLEA
ncbi:MAG: NUDIX domain-containing protein [Deltaproteobacteria bacterium]|nr:NUDIX domain-containing protein [Deltaproteobacteria bacterium]MBW2715103.1 NUDIX domain-containing protein [Deltaproteobacteria bacterium]